MGNRYYLCLQSLWNAFDRFCIAFSFFFAGIDRRCTWRKFMDNKDEPISCATPQHLIHQHHSNASTDTDLTTLENHELWLTDSTIPEPTSTKMTALHVFGAEMLKLSRGLESFAANAEAAKPQTSETKNKTEERFVLAIVHLSLNGFS